MLQLKAESLLLPQWLLLLLTLVVVCVASA
jgi:hypothetical protein